MLVRTLGLLRMSGTFYCRSELTARWGVTLPSKPGHMWFHVVTEGEAWLEVLTLECEQVSERYEIRRSGKAPGYTSLGAA